MADRRIKVLADGRIVGVGASRIDGRTFSFLQPDTDRSTILIDYTRFLAGATISSVTATGSGVTASVSTSSPNTTITLYGGAGAANVEVVMTASDARKHTLWLNIDEITRCGTVVAPDYQFSR